MFLERAVTRGRHHAMARKISLQTHLGPVNALEFGAPEAPLIIAIQGKSSNLDVITEWEAAADLLSRSGAHIVLPNLHSNEATSPGLVASVDLQRIILGIYERWHAETAIVMAKSWGGGEAVTFAAAHPDRVRRLVLVAPSLSDTSLISKISSMPTALFWARDDGVKSFELSRQYMSVMSAIEMHATDAGGHRVLDEYLPLICRFLQNELRSAQPTKFDAPLTPEHLLVALPDRKCSLEGGRVQLSPVDLLCKGRSTPMTWFYERSLDISGLLAALRVTLEGYPLLCGRYDACPPTCVRLCNAGVPVEIRRESSTTLAEAIAHLATCNAGGQHSVFDRAAHEPYIPDKAPMDPDVGNVGAPLMSIRLTCFANGGTAVGLLMQHGVVDAESQMLFMRHWARASRNLRGDELWQPAVCSDRWLASADGDGTIGMAALDSARDTATSDTVATAAIEAARPEGFRVHCIPPAEERPPEFIGVMPRINGPSVCVVPLTRRALASLKGRATAELPGERTAGAQPCRVPISRACMPQPHRTRSPHAPHCTPFTSQMASLFPRMTWRRRTRGAHSAR